MPRELPDVLKDQRGTFPIYLSFFALAAFLLLIVFGPGIGNRLGFLGERKEQQISLATTPAPDFDYDGDGFLNSIELYIGTAPDRSCSATAIANDEGLPDSWPPDFNDNRTVDSLDESLLKQHIAAPHPTSPKYAKRFDLNADQKINQTDLAIWQIYKGKSCIPPLPSCSIYAKPATITSGSFSTLTWFTSYAGYASITPNPYGGGIYVLPTNLILYGSITISPQSTTTYTMEVRNDSGSRTCSATVTVGTTTPTPTPAPIPTPKPTPFPTPTPTPAPIP